MNRREFVAAGVGVLPNLTDIHQRVSAVWSGSTPSDLTYLHGALERHGQGYRGREPEAALGDLRGDLALLGDLLGRAHRAKDGAEVAHVAAGLCGVVGIIEHDQGRERAAHAWFTSAAHAAEDAGDRQMLGWVLARQAMLPLNYGSPQVATGLAERARAAAGRAATPAAALATAVSARALAAAGQRERAIQAVRATRDIAARLEVSGRTDTWFGYPDQKHHVHLSQALTLIGDTRQARAEQAAAFALTDPRSVLTRGLLELDQAACACLDGDQRAAADVAVATWVSLPPAYRRGLVGARAHALRDRLAGDARARLADALAA